MIRVNPSKGVEVPFKILDVTMYTNMVVVNFQVIEGAREICKSYRVQIGTDCEFTVVETSEKRRIYHQSVKLDDREKTILSKMENEESKEEKRFLFYADRVSRAFRSSVVILGFVDTALYQAMNSKDGVNANVRNITNALLLLLKENEIGD